MASSSIARINGWEEFRRPADGCRGRCSKRKRCCIANRRGCRWELLAGWSLAVYVSSSFLLLHRYYCIRTCALRCPRPYASFCGRSPLAAMNGVVFRRGTTASSADLCTTSLEHQRRGRSLSSESIMVRTFHHANFKIFVLLVPLLKIPC